MFTSVAGRTVIVTGGGKGIGKGIARVFARSGANVIITGRDEETLATTAKELTAAGGVVDGVVGGVVGYVVADVVSAADAARVAATARERHGGIDVVCANAGIFPSATLAEMTVEDIDTMLGVNVKGAILSVQACLPDLIASGHGRVILTSSITGPVTGFPGWSHYGASKAAMLGFMRTAAIELARDKITVNAVLPGNIVTEGLSSLGADYLASMEGAIPMGRLGEVDEVGYAALFLASDEAAYITAQSITVDGGQILPESPAALE